MQTMHESMHLQRALFLAPAPESELGRYGFPGSCAVGNRITFDLSSCASWWSPVAQKYVWCWSVKVSCTDSLCAYTSHRHSKHQHTER